MTDRKFRSVRSVEVALVPSRIRLFEISRGDRGRSDLTVAVNRPHVWGCQSHELLPRRGVGQGATPCPCPSQNVRPCRRRLSTM